MDSRQAMFQFNSLSTFEMMKISFPSIIAVFIINLVMLNVAESRSRDPKPTCPAPSAVEIKEVLSSHISSDFSINSYHFSCLAVRAFNLYASLAVIVTYTAETGTGTTPVNETVWVSMECDNSYNWSLEEYQMVDGGEDMMLPQTQYQC